MYRNIVKTRQTSQWHTEWQTFHPAHPSATQFANAYMVYMIRLYDKVLPNYFIGC